MSLIELLLALALLVVMSASLVAGLVVVRHAYRQDRAVGEAADLDEALRSVAQLFESAYPVLGAKDPRHPVVRFEGQADEVAFVGLGDGRTLRGGLHAIAIGLDGGALYADVTPMRETQTAPDGRLTRRVVLNGHVAGLRFRYFGQTHAGERPAWRESWSYAERQPDLIAIEIEGAAGRPMRLTAAVPQS